MQSHSFTHRTTISISDWSIVWADSKSIVSSEDISDQRIESGFILVFGEDGCTVTK